MASEIKANKISPATGTAFTIGDSGDTFTLPSGATLAVASGATISNAGTASGFTSTAVVQAYMTANQSFTKDVYAKVNFDAEHVDSKGWYDTTTQRFTPLSAGFYFVSVNLVKQVAETQFNSVYTSIYKNGVNDQTFYVYGDYPYYQQQMMFSANTVVYLNGSTDYVEAWFKWGANGTLGVSSGGSFGQQSRLEIWRLDP
jgi:hypothetical protein